MKFKAGDIVKCKDDRNSDGCEIPLVYNQNYVIIEARLTACGCKIPIVDVGMRFKKKVLFSFCAGDCNKDKKQQNVPGRGIRWLNENSFELAPPEESGTSIEMKREIKN